MKRCAGCGRELAEHLKFCPDCGTPVEAQRDGNAVPLRQPQGHDYTTGVMRYEPAVRQESAQTGYSVQQPPAGEGPSAKGKRRLPAQEVKSGTEPYYMPIGIPTEKSAGREGRRGVFVFLGILFVLLLLIVLCIVYLSGALAL